MAASEAEVRKFYDDWINKLQKKAADAVGAAIKEAYARYFILAEEKIKTIFYTAVDHFYSSQFKPNLYERRFSMKDVLNTKTTKDSLSVSFDPSRMTYRSGYGGEDGLYDLVFREGWHGGAKRGFGHPDANSSSGPNSNTADIWLQPYWQSDGTPHWRYPAPYYTFWGRQAEREDISPLQEIRRSWADYEENQMQGDFSELLNDELKNMKINWFN